VHREGHGETLAHDFGENVIAYVFFRVEPCDPGPERRVPNPSRYIA